MNNPETKPKTKPASAPAPLLGRFNLPSRSELSKRILASQLRKRDAIAYARHCLGVATKDFRTAFEFLRLVRLSLYEYVRNSAKHLFARSLLRLGFVCEEGCSESYDISVNRPNETSSATRRSKKPTTNNLNQNNENKLP